jgi:quinol monooxygenase YgiN
MTYHDDVPEHVVSANNAGTTQPSTRRTILTRAFLLVASASLLSGLIPTTAEAAAEKEPGPAIVNVVTFEVPRTEEPGCIGFDVLLPKDEPNTVMLIESYRDEAAYKAHRVTPHFLTFVKRAQEIGAKRSAHVGTRYYPS